MDLRDALSGVMMSVAALVLAVAAARTSIQARHSASIARPRLLVGSRLSMATACGLLAASFLLSASRRPSFVLLVAAATAFVLGFSLERVRARGIGGNVADGDRERP
jgi:hypothetical protein